MRKTHIGTDTENPHRNGMITDAENPHYRVSPETRTTFYILGKGVEPPTRSTICVGVVLH